MRAVGGWVKNVFFLFGVFWVFGFLVGLGFCFSTGFFVGGFDHPLSFYVEYHTLLQTSRTELPTKPPTKNTRGEDVPPDRAPP